MSHIHPVVDTDAHYKIDGISRTIVNIDETKRELVQGDHNSERFTFEIPRYIDGHDFSECNIVQIHYENADTFGKNISTGIYTVNDLQVKHDDEETVVLSWLASNNATKYVGSLNFSVRFVCSLDGDIDYAWSTRRFEGITILPGVYNTDEIAEENADVIVDLSTKIQEVEKKSNTFVSFSKQQTLESAQKAQARTNIGAISQAELDEAIANADASGDFISYTETQNLTDEQKAQARKNINAVDASLVKSSLGAVDSLSKNIFTVSGTQEFVENNALNPNLPNNYPAFYIRKMREHLDVDGGMWELLYTIEGDGETALWEYTRFADGSPLKLTAVSAVIIQDVAEAENSYGHLYAYCNEKSTQFPAAIYSYFTKNSAPTTSGMQRAYGVVEQYKGQYRAYSVGMAAKGNEVMRYTPYMQGKSTTSDHPYIDRIKIHKQTGVFSVGNKIEVYGVRYYE